MRNNRFLSYSILDQSVICYNALYDKFIVLKKNVYSQFLSQNYEWLKNNVSSLYDFLLKSKFIVEDDFCELKIAKFRRTYLKFDTTVFHIVINTTFNCNLDCWYCYEKKSAGTQLKQITIDSIKEVLRYKYDEVRYKELKISFFGGEPLMNMKAIRELCQFAKIFCSDNEIKLLCDFTTNATLINNNFLDFLKDYNTTFQITLDGHRECHNSIRYNRKTKSGTYDIIVDNVSKILNTLPNSYVWLRINFDNKTLNDIPQIINDINSFDRKRCSVILRKVWQVDIDSIEKSALLRAIDLFIDNDFFVDYFALPRILPCFAERYNQVLINYDGGVFKCSTLDSFDNNSSLGHLDKTGKITFDSAKLAEALIESDLKTCNDCSLYPACYGPCNKNRPKEVERFKCLLNNLGLSKDELILYNFKLRILHENSTRNKNYE